MPADPTPPARRRVRAPTVLQMEAAECGAASLAMVLAAHGLWVPLEELRTACRVSRDGSKAGNVVRAARTYGLDAAGYRYDVAQLRGLPMPAIVFVNLNHFLVLEGFARDRVFLNDPAAGRRTLQIAEFEGIYSGVVMTFEPTQAFRPGGRRPRVLGRLARWLEGARAGFFFTVLAGVGLVLPGLVMPGFTRVFIDDYLIGRQADWVAWLLGAMAAAALAQGGLLWLKQTVERRLETRVALLASGRFVWRLLRLPYGFFVRRHAGSVGGRTDLAPQIGAHAGRALGSMLVDGVAILVFAAAMAAYGGWLAAVVVAAAGGNLLLFLLSRRRLEEMNQKATLDHVKLAGKTMQGLQMIESLKANGTDGPFFEGWSGQLALLETQQQAIARVAARVAVLPDAVTQAATVAVLAVGGILVMRGQLTVGTLIAFQGLQANFMLPVQRLMQTALTLQGARGPMEQLDDVLDHAEAVEFARPTTAAAAPAGPLGAPQRLSGRLAVRALTFGYTPNEAPLLEGFDLDLPPGARVALVGGSGSGKSTVGKLLAGLLEPWSGDIRLDGRPLAEIPRPLLRRSLAVVDQEIVLFEGTVRDNITLWDPDMPDNLVVQAARDAEIHDGVMARPGGYAGPVTEGGGNFSGGQRQRLEIARALVGGPTLLVLDEATSALDPVVEKAVMGNLRRRGCACVIIAHRLSTIRDCDEIIVMDRGRVVQRGTHEALIAVDGPYRTLVDA